jgi:Zn-dependent alcohol dehydrogenase
MKIMVFEKKCKHCEQWSWGKKLVCESCSKPLDKVRLRDYLKRSHRPDPFVLNLFEVHAGDGHNMIISKNIARVVSYLFLGVAAFITLLIVIATGIY